MLEPSPRYTAGGVGGGGGGTGQALQIDTHHSGLETAVDLSRKSEAVTADEADQEDSEDEAPLDLKVRPRTGSCSSSISVGGGKPLYLSDIQKAEQSMPNLQQRAELLRIAEAMHTGTPSGSGAAAAGLPLPSNIRSSSQERELPSLSISESACSLCGADTQSPDFRPSDHGENLCGRGTISCPLCAKTFSLWSHYEAHKKCHQKLKQRQYPCQTCGKIFTSASNRNMHQRIHKGVRPFQCTPCGVFFRQKAHLQKHQKTQGHIQATEIYEKKKREGGGNGSSDQDSSSNSGKGSSPHSSSMMINLMRPDSVRSVDSNGSASTLSLLADSTSPTSGGSALANESFSPLGSSSFVRAKSSPKRKQAKPSQLLVSENNNEEHEDSEELDNTQSVIVAADNEEVEDLEEEEIADCRVSTSEDKLNAFIDYNDIQHGYDCNQCTFASHDLANMKEHVREEHLNERCEEKLKCKECQITFSKEFNLKIHNRKHATSSQFLPCDFCEQVFKVPNKLIKHMEAVHSVCPTCGDRQEDKASLVRHLEDIHENRSKGFHTNLLHFTPLMSHLSPTNSLSIEHRMAKKRKVDSLAESIRQKKEMKSLKESQASSSSSSFTPIFSPKNRSNRKNIEQTMRSPNPPATISADHVAIAASLLSLQPQPISQLLHHHKHGPRRGENNNVLSSLHANLKLPPSVQLPTKPVAGLTPPSSPPPLPTSGGQIRGEVSVTIVGGSNSEDSDENEAGENGLDLSISKRRNSDEHEVSTTANTSSQLPDFYGRLPPHLQPPSAPHHHLPVPPFPFLPPLPPGAADHHPALAEHLLKLASLHPRAGIPPPIPPPELPKAGPNSSPYTVLSAMLGHHTTSHFPTVFPGMPSVFPSTSSVASLACTSPASLSTSIKEEPQIASSTEKKPFVCNFCRKEFGHLSSLEAHMDHMHSGDAKHTCETCGKSFSSKSNLTAHKKIHSGERPFECAVCHKRFRQKAHLQKHETTHSSATPYKCSVCDKAFGHISNLNTHMATHSNVRPYQCADCGKSYKDSASFKRHRLGHTGERPYACDLCEETFIDSKAVRRHRELAHPGHELPPNLWHRSHAFEDEEEVDDDEESEMTATPSTSAYSSFESGKDKENEEIEVEMEMAEDEEDS